jgi:hypothetical protein
MLVRSVSFLLIMSIFVQIIRRITLHQSYPYTIDVTTEKSWQEVRLMPLKRTWLSSSENPDYHQKNMNNWAWNYICRFRFERGWKLLNAAKPGRRVWALHFLVMSIRPMAFQQNTHSLISSASYSIPGLTPVSLLGSESGFETVTQPDNRKRPSSHLCSRWWRSYRPRSYNNMSWDHCSKYLFRISSLYSYDCMILYTYRRP